MLMDAFKQADKNSQNQCCNQQHCTILSVTRCEFKRCGGLH